MGSVQLTCGLNRCYARLPPRPSFKCPHCLDVPEDDPHGARSDYAYYSKQHLDVDREQNQTACERRRTQRWMSHAAAIVTDFFVCNRAEMFSGNIAGMRLWENGKHCGRNILIDIGHLSEKSKRRARGLTGAETVLGAISFDMCINAVTMIVPLLEWLLEGKYTTPSPAPALTPPDLDVAIEEVSALPKKTRQVYLAHLIGDDEVERWGVAQFHVFANIKPASPDMKAVLGRGFSLDLSSMQYGNAMKAMRTSEHSRDRIRRNSSTTRRFGHHYETVRRPRLAGSCGPERQVKAFRLEASIRLGNNVVEHWADEHGGREGLEDMSHKEFLLALDGLQDRLAEAFKTLREYHDSVGDSISLLKEVADVCWGESKEVMYRAYDAMRSSGRVAI